MFDSPTLKQMLKIGLVNCSLKCAYFSQWSMKGARVSSQLSTSRLSVSEVRQHNSHSHNVSRKNLTFSQGSVMREEIKERKPDYYLSKNSKCMKKIGINIFAMTVLIILLTLSAILRLSYVFKV